MQIIKITNICNAKDKGFGFGVIFSWDRWLKGVAFLFIIWNISIGKINE